MGITAISGPQVAYGVTVSSSGATAEYNEQRGPSVCDLGEMLMDPRPGFCYVPGAAPTTPVRGWAGLFGGPVIDQVPSGVSTASVATSFSATAATGTVTISGSAVGAPAAGNYQLTRISGFVPSTYTGLANPSSISVWGIDVAGASTATALSGGVQFGGLGFGSAGAIQIWDPTHAITRSLSIVGTSGSSGTLYTVNGFDLYGYNLTCTVQGASAGVSVNTPKAFKYINTISFASTGAAPSTAVTIGVSDNYGFPLRCDHPAYTTVWWGQSSVATLTTLSQHTFASTATATSTTGDVRGTFASTAASSGATLKLVMLMSPSAQNLQAMSLSSLNTSSQGILWQSAGLVGVPQF